MSIDDAGLDAPGPAQPKFDLNTALSALANDSPAMQVELQRDEQTLLNIRQKIMSESKKNFVLERELSEIDEKIKLVVRHRITLQEAMNAVSNATEKKGDDVSPLQGKREVYEEMFHLLQSKPRYFAKLTSLVESKETPTFVQTVVFDMYGDQYDSREERLLLNLFQKVLKDELAKASSQGSLLRANTAITQMLSAYARRGQGLSILKDILEQPLKDITSQKDLNLEVDPMKVYMQIITDYETKTGQTSDLPRNITGEEAAKHPEVEALVAKRTQQLLDLSDMILTRIINGVETIPYGMRWICKQLGSLCKERFPEADRYQIGSLMGGYIYLRFFNPVIVTPDALNFIKNKPSRVMRRNLILIAKILQNLSNGVFFGDKEQYMKPMNEFIKAKREVLLDYFDQLVKVDDLSDALQVDKYLEHTAKQFFINISFNQIFLIHSLLERHIDHVCKGMDPMKKILQRAGKAPDKVPKKDDRTIVLTLSKDSRKQRLSTTADAFAVEQKEVNPLYVQAKTLLLSVLRLLPSETTESTLIGFLEKEKAAALAEDDGSLADHITNVKSMLHTLATMGLLNRKDTVDETFNNFLWEIAMDAVSRANRLPVVKKRLELVASAHQSISKHHEYLLQRLDMYKMYLDNVRAGGGHMGAEKDKKGKKSKKNDKQVFKATHPQLVSDKVIQSVDPSVSESVLKKCYYLFTQVEPGKFEITIHLKKGFDIKLPNKITLVLEDLLAMQEHGQVTLPADAIELNVNFLMHLLKKNFKL